MISPKDFNAALIKNRTSIQEFARKSGKRVTTIKKYCKSGVPDKDESTIRQMMTNMEKPIFFGEQTAFKDL